MKNTPTIFFLSFCFLTATVQAATVKRPVGVQLIGVYNQLTKHCNAPSANPPSVRVRSTREPITGLPWMPSAFLKLPLEIEVTFAAKNLDAHGIPQPYIIKLKEDPQHSTSCAPDKTSVTAQIYLHQPGDLDAWPETKQSTCVSKSVFFMKAGDLISQWQNIMLFVADPDDPSSTIPFSFGLAAWTSTSGLWHYDFIDYAPADAFTNAPKITFEKVITTINNHQEPKGLRVLQGQQTFGGGQLPRPYFLHIAHLYNASSYPVLLRRSVRELSAYNFSKLVPARSIIPFAMVWLPKLTSDQAMQPSTNPIELFVLRKAKKEQLPEAFSSIDEVGGSEISAGVSDQEINGAIDNIIQNMSNPAQALANYGSMIETLQHDPDEQYVVGNYSYKLFAIKGKTATAQQTICINRCERDSTDEATIEQLTDRAFSGVQPRYYTRLIISDKKGSGNTLHELVDLDLAMIHEETVFDHSLEKV